MPDSKKATVKIFSNTGQKDCCDLRIEGLGPVDDLVNFRHEVNMTGFSVTNAASHKDGSIVWTLVRPDREVISPLHNMQLKQAVVAAGMKVA